LRAYDVIALCPATDFLDGCSPDGVTTDADTLFVLGGFAALASHPKKAKVSTVEITIQNLNCERLRETHGN
jgi:hypothetical protein